MRSLHSNPESHIMSDMDKSTEETGESMISLILFIVAVAPVVVFMLVINFNGKIEKEPFGLQLGLMGMGVLSTIPAMLIELLGSAILGFILPGFDCVHLY